MNTQAVFMSQALVSTFKPTHQYNGFPYRKLGHVTIKDPDTGNWLSGILYQSASGELHAREQSDFMTKFRVIGVNEEIADLWPGK